MLIIASYNNFLAGSYVARVVYNIVINNSYCNSKGRSRVDPGDQDATLPFKGTNVVSEWQNLQIDFWL